MFEAYYHPVKDLLTEGMRKDLINHFEAHERKHFIYTNKSFYEEHADKHALAYRTEGTVGFVNYHSLHENPSSVENETIKKIAHIYGADAGMYIHTKGEGELLSPHRDPIRGGCVTFPLYPDYNSYRHTQFYAEDMKTIVCEIEWNMLKSPALLNNQQIHGLNNKQNNLKSLCLQVSYNNCSYEEAKEILRERDLLATPI